MNNDSGRTVKILREKRAWSQEHLAAVSGLNVRTIQRIESKSDAPASLETFNALAAAFDIDVKDLVGSSTLLRLFQQALDLGEVRPDPLLGHVACPLCDAPAADFAHKTIGDDIHTVVIARCPHCGWSEDVVV
jgi:transcriptional regulator with XRE-family HTH domain